MGFWSKTEAVFKAIGSFFADMTVELPKIIHAGNVAAAQVPTIVADIGKLLNAVNKLVNLAVTDAKPIIAGLVSLGESVFTAIGAGLTNIQDDEQVVIQTENLITQIKNDYPAFANFTSALNEVVETYDEVAASIKTAVAAVEQAVDPAPTTTPTPTPTP